MATPKYLLGKLLTGAAGEAELVAELGSDYEYLEPDTPVTIATILDSYGPDKEPEVQEALGIAKTKELGDIERMLATWLKRNIQRRGHAVQGFATMSKEMLGRRGNPDVEGKMAEFLTGVKGPVDTQMKTLKQQASRAGRRRKSKKTLRRKTKKSRRTYK